MVDSVTRGKAGMSNELNVSRGVGMEHNSSILKRRKGWTRPYLPAHKLPCEEPAAGKSPLKKSI